VTEQEKKARLERADAGSVPWILVIWLVGFLVLWLL
jgi:hypothetical protein